jgi:Ca2+-binding RTX toxin-like protein
MIKPFDNSYSARATNRHSLGRRRCSMEMLERREMMAGDMWIQEFDGTSALVIDGGSGADKAYVSNYDAFNVTATLNGKSERFPLFEVEKIIFYGREGNDYFDNDTRVPTEAYGHGGNDKLVGGTGKDYLSGGTGDDVVDGSGGNDEVHGNSGNDTLYGGPGNDVLEGGTDNDRLDGGDNDDTYVFSGSGLGSDEIFGTLGVNTIDLRGRGGSNSLDLALTSKQTVKAGELYLTLKSSAAIDNVFGSDWADTIKGNSLANRIYGFGGNDTLTGREGADHLDGGTGTDTFPELKTSRWTVSFSSPGWNSSSYKTQRVYPTSGYGVVGSSWSVTSAIRADSGRLPTAGYVDVYAFLYPEQFGSGGARVSGTLTLEMMPQGDTLVK